MKRIIMITIVIVLFMVILINGNPTEGDSVESSIKQVEKAEINADTVKKTVKGLAESAQNVVNKTADGVNNLVDKIAEGMPSKSSSLQANLIISFISNVFLFIVINQF